MPDKIYLGENAQSFKTMPKFSAVDMVVLNLDENTFVSSPYVMLDEDVWSSSWQRRYNGKYVYSYDQSLSGWKQTSGPYYFTGTVLDLTTLGITAVFTDAVPEKAGDTITVNRFAETKTDDNPEPQIVLTIELTRSGRTIETTCPLCKSNQRQAIADSLLQSLCAYRYQPFSATNAEVNPLAELGDGVTIHGIYGGLYQQELDFSSIMSSDIGAPGEEEIEHDFDYETESERKYSRKFADISAEFEIHATEIEAKVSKEGTGDGFSWSLVYDGFSVRSGNKTVFLVDKTGASVEGTIKATDGIIGGFTIGSNAIYKDIETFGSEEKSSGVYLGTNGIQLGKNFKVTNQGTVTASNLTINGGSINLGKYSNNGSDDYYFKVSSYGYVTAKKLTADGMSASNASFTDCNISGNLTVGGRAITAYTLYSGAQSAFTNGSYWTNAYNWTSGKGSYCVEGSGYGFNYNSVTSQYSNSYVGRLRVNELWVYRFYVPGQGYFKFTVVGKEAKLVKG